MREPDTDQRDATGLQALIVILLLIIVGLYVLQHWARRDTPSRYAGVPVGAIPLLQHVLNPSGLPLY